MATPFDPNAFFPPFYDAPDPSTLQWPWSQPPPEQLPVDLAPIDPLAAPPPDPDPMLAAPPVAPPAPMPAPIAEPVPAPMLSPPLAAEPPVPLPELPAAPTELPSERDRATQDALNQRALTDQAGFAEDLVRSDQDRANYIAQRRKELADADIAAARQNVEDRQAADAATRVKMDAVLADAQRIADTKIDPTGGVTGVRRIAGVIGAIVGGLVQGQTGSSRNAGMDALNDIINRGIEAQKADLANQRDGINTRRSVLAQELAQHGDMFRAEEAVRLASLQHADDILAFEQQNYDQRGRTGLLIAGQRAQVAAAKAQAVEAAGQKDFENGLKLQDAARQQEIADETARNNRAQNYLRGQEIGEQRATREEAKAQRLADKEFERADKEAERDRQFTIGGAPHVRVGPDGKPVMGPDGKPAISYDALRNADGATWRAASPEEAKDLRTKKTAHTQVIKNLDRIVAIRERVGGESKLLNSDEAQELEGLSAETILLKKSGTQGMSSDKDLDLIAQSSGVGDAASWRAQKAKILSARARAADGLNQAFRDANYTGPSLEFPESKPTESTLDEVKFQALLEKPDESLKAARQQLDEARAAGFTDVGYNPDASIRQQVGIARLGQEAAGPADDERASTARTRLQQIAASAPTSALRQLARVTLESALRSGIGSSEETTTATRTRGASGEQSTATPVPDELRLP